MKGLLKSAIRSNNPVLFLEHKQLYKTKMDIPEEEYLLPIGKADVKRAGSDCTVVAVGLMVSRTLEAAEILAKEGIEVEVIDPAPSPPWTTRPSMTPWPRPTAWWWWRNPTSPMDWALKSPPG